MANRENTDNALSPFRPGAGGNLNDDRPANWQTSDEQCAQETAKFAALNKPEENKPFEAGGE